VLVEVTNADGSRFRIKSNLRRVHAACRMPHSSAGDSRFRINIHFGH
jgi:hypothetical protein